MSQKDKLINKLKNKPRNFTFDDAESLLRSLGYTRFDKGKQVGQE